jgi:anion-transporting  ArsA/GET3 family ATPase
MTRHTAPPSRPSSRGRTRPRGELVPGLETRRFLFVTGKGGVGKTTVSGAMALAYAARGKRVLVALPHTKERLSAILGSPPIGDEIIQAAPNVWAVNLSPEKALVEYGHIILKVRALTSAVFDNRYTKTFFRAVPGLYEWAMLGKAWYHTTEKLPDGSNRFDIVLFDAPATGHGLDMLRVPKVILDVVPPGVLRRDAEAAWALFRDPSRSGVVVVTLPEEMPTTETIELVHSIRSELGLPVLQVIANGVLPALFPHEDRVVMMQHPELLGVDAPARAVGTPEAALVAGARRAVREEVQAESLHRLIQGLGALPHYELPFLFDDASTAAGTRRLAKMF